MDMAESKPSTSNSKIAEAVRKAAGSIAPCWPLKEFVAVNPFVGMADHDFCDAACRMARVAGAHLFMPRSFYAEALATGRIQTQDLEAALEDLPKAAAVVGGLRALEESVLPGARSHGPTVLPTVADVARGFTGVDWPELVNERLSRWAASYFDGGQASWGSPWQNLSPYSAWRAEALLDRSPAIAGLSGYREVIASLPESADALVYQAVDCLSIPEPGLELYFHRLLMVQGGWSAHARYRDWQSNLRGEGEYVVAELLAVRLAWEVILLRCVDDTRIAQAWTLANERLAAPDPGRNMPFAVEALLQHAYERAWQRELIRSFTPRALPEAEARPVVQAAFCIDVRSEIYRRALESSMKGAQTIGFAGFFGIAMSYLPVAHETPRPQCPALLAPRYVIVEDVKNAPHAEDVARARRVWYAVSAAWKSFRSGAVASFAYVETLGILFGLKLITDSLGITRPVPNPSIAGLPQKKSGELVPRIEAELRNDHKVGLTLDERVTIGGGALRAMSLTRNFARIVLLAGHGSTSVNNPHAAGLNCGACGGHAGDVNARVVAAILNDPEVRTRLAATGIAIPEDTIFMAANHDTTTENVTLFDVEAVPLSHRDELRSLMENLAQASTLARQERAAKFNPGSPEAHESSFVARSRDWSHVRPEWGLAGCASFIAAPRHRSRHLKLDGRAFLHDYDWRQDEDFGVLELVMTAPLVVANWISLQYYGSTVDNRVFGSGYKTLHNVVGSLGVFEGNGGDLRVGLPWQSLHDGERLVHEPMRLTALFEAPVEAMNSVISKNEGLRALLDHGWMSLYALDAQGVVSKRYCGKGEWAEVVAEGRSGVEAA